MGVKGYQLLEALNTIQMHSFPESSDQPGINSLPQSTRPAAGISVLSTFANLLSQKMSLAVSICILQLLE